MEKVISANRSLFRSREEELRFGFEEACKNYTEINEEYEREQSKLNRHEYPLRENPLYYCEQFLNKKWGIKYQCSVPNCHHQFVEEYPYNKEYEHIVRNSHGRFQEEECPNCMITSRQDILAYQNQYGNWKKNYKNKDLVPNATGEDLEIIYKCHTCDTEKKRGFKSSIYKDVLKAQKSQAFVTSIQCDNCKYQNRMCVFYYQKACDGKSIYNIHRPKPTEEYPAFTNRSNIEEKKPNRNGFTKGKLQ